MDEAAHNLVAASDNIIALSGGAKVHQCDCSTAELAIGSARTSVHAHRRGHAAQLIAGALPLLPQKEATEVACAYLKSTQPTPSRRTGRVPGQALAPRATRRRRHTEPAGE
jgi:hypothetical protein